MAGIGGRRPEGDFCLYKRPFATIGNVLSNAAIDQAAELDASSVKAYYRLSVGLSEMDRSAEALEVLQKVNIIN